MTQANFEELICEFNLARLGGLKGLLYISSPIKFNFI